MGNSVKPLQDWFTAVKVIEKANEIHPRYGLLLHFGIVTGLRISDILSTRISDVTGMVIPVTEKKTLKRRLVRLNGVLKREIGEHIKKYNLDLSDYLFFSSMTRKNKPMHRVQAYRVIKKAAERVGLKGVGAHSMRKTYAREQFKANKDLFAIQRALNHKYVTTTLDYLFDRQQLGEILVASMSSACQANVE